MISPSTNRATLALILAAATFISVGCQKKQEEEKSPTTQTNTGTSSKITAPASTAPVVTTVERKAPTLPEKLYVEPQEAGDYNLLKDLNRPESTINKDLEVVKDVFYHYRSAFKENPVGNHQEIVKILSGKNKQNIAYMPETHPAVQSNTLYDRWGVPFFFHQISGEIMEIRSAGPDRRHWTQDDVVIR